MDSFLDSTPYETRVVSTYADKLEVFAPRHGAFDLPGEFYHGANFHYVTIDVQAFIMVANDNAETPARYAALYRAASSAPKFYTHDSIFPTVPIMLEGEVFPAPREVEQVLEITYGSLEQGAVFNPNTGL